MCTNDGEADHQSRDEKRSDAGEEDHDDCQKGQAEKGFPVGEGPAENDQRLIGLPEDVEESPGREEGEENGEGERVGKQRKGEDEGEEG